MPLQLNLPCRMMGKAGPPLTPSVPPQLHACSCFPSSSPPLQALPHNLALGHLLQIRAGSQTRTRGSSPACAYQCRLLAAIRAGGESLLSQLLPDPRVMKVGFKGAEIGPGRGSIFPVEMLIYIRVSFCSPFCTTPCPTGLWCAAVIPKHIPVL